MKKRLTKVALYLIGPLVVLAVVALAVAPEFFTPAGIPVTAPAAVPVDHTTANLTGLAASLAGAIVLGVSIWWMGRKAEG